MTRARPSSVGIALTAIAVLVLAAALRCAIFATLYDGDMELFVYMGKLAGQGGRVGVELIDNKLPTVGLLMWLPYQLVGAWWPGYALIGVLAAAAAVFAVARAAANVHRSSLWPTAAMAAAWMSFPLAVFSAFKLEHVTLATSALSAWAFVRCWRNGGRSNALCVGLLAGVGALAKPNALAVFGAAAIAISTAAALPWRERWRILGWMCAGLAVPVAITIIYLIRADAFGGLVTSFRQIRSYNHNSIWQPQAVLFKSLTVVFLVALPLVMRGVIERKRREPHIESCGVVWRFALLWLVLEIAGIALQGRMYGYHFLPLTAPASLLFGLIPRRPMTLSIVGSAAPVLAASVFWAWTATLATERPADRLAAIDFVKTHAAAHDGVWMDEYARLLVETDLAAGSRVPLTFIFSNDDDAPDTFGNMLVGDLNARRPRWVVLPADCRTRAEMLRERRIEFAERPTRGERFVRAWSRIESAVRADFVPVARFGDQCVYERRTAITAATTE